MAAADDFPRGLTQSVGAASQAIITFPATAGIAWKLKSIDAIAFAYGGQAASILSIATSLGAGGPEGIVLVAGGVVASGEWSWSGGCQGAIGAALQVYFTGPVANIYQTLAATAEPI